MSSDPPPDPVYSVRALPSPSPSIPLGASSEDENAFDIDDLHAFQANVVPALKRWQRRVRRQSKMAENQQRINSSAATRPARKERLSQSPRIDVEQAKLVVRRLDYNDFKYFAQWFSHHLGCYRDRFIRERFGKDMA